MAKVGGTQTKIVGLAEFQRDLRLVDKRWGTELRLGLKEAAEIGASHARSKAQSMSPLLRKAADAIRATSEQRASKLAFTSNAKRLRFATGAFLGAKAYPQFQPWVGSSWEVGRRGSGPYAINDAVADKENEIVDAVADSFDRIARKAFPR